MRRSEGWRTRRRELESNPTLGCVTAPPKSTTLPAFPVRRLCTAVVRYYRGSRSGRPLRHRHPDPDPDPSPPDVHHRPDPDFDDPSSVPRSYSTVRGTLPSLSCHHHHGPVARASRPQLLPLLLLYERGVRRGGGGPCRRDRPGEKGSRRVGCASWKAHFFARALTGESKSVRKGKRRRAREGQKRTDS